MKDQKERIGPIKAGLLLSLLIFTVVSATYGIFSERGLLRQTINYFTKKSPASLDKNQTEADAFNKLLEEKKQLDKSIATLMHKNQEIENLKTELTSKIKYASEKIKPFIRIIPKKESSSESGMITCNYSKNSEEIERELQTIQYNKTYIRKLDEISRQINTAIIRSVFVSNKFDTDIQVASVIGRDAIGKIREEVNNKIQENIPLSATITVNNSDFENSANLDEIWETLYTECLYEKQRRGEILSNLETHLRTKSDLEEKISTIKKLKEESRAKIELTSQRIKDLRKDDRAVTKIDPSGVVRYLNYARDAFEVIEWDKTISKDLQIILYQESYLEELKTMEERFESGIRKSTAASQNFNGYSTNKLIELIYLDKKKEDYEKIIKTNQENWQILNANNPLKIKVKPAGTPKEIWDRFKIPLEVRGVKVETSSEIPPNRPGYIVHRHNEHDTFHEHPEHCEGGGGFVLCGSPH